MKILLFTLFLLVANCSAQCTDATTCTGTGTDSKPQAGVVLGPIPNVVLVDPSLTPPPVAIPVTAPVIASVPITVPVDVLPCAAYNRYGNHNDEDADEKVCAKCNPSHFGKNCTCKILPTFSYLEHFNNNSVRAWWGYQINCNGTVPRYVSIPLSNNNHFKSGKVPKNYGKLQCEGKNYSAVFYTEYDSRDVSDTWEIGGTTASFTTNTRSITSDANVQNTHIVLLLISVVLMACVF